jgi:NADH:ubiquinone oxidoreductase subunit E
MEEDNLEKQFIPYLEPIVNQTLEMVETISKGENFDKSEIIKLLNELQDNFGEYIHMMSPETQGRILEVSYQLDNFDEIYDLQDAPPNT